MGGSVEVPRSSSSCARSRTRSTHRTERLDVVMMSEPDARISTAGVIIADSTSRTEESSRVPANSGHISERRACQVLVIGFGDHDVVLDANAAESAECIHLRPVDKLRPLALSQLLEQRGDEVQARLDGKHHPRLDRSGQTQIRMT